MTNKICVYCWQEERLAKAYGHNPHCPVTHSAMGNKINPFVSADLIKKQQSINLPNKPC